MQSFQNNAGAGDDRAFDYIFCGAGFAAAGAAAKLADGGASVLLIDEHCFPGSEYALAMHSGKIGADSARIAAADELAGELYRRMAISADGVIEPAALMPVLCRIIERRGGKIAFFPSSVPVSKKRTPDGWQVEFVTNGICHTAHAGYLVSADAYDTLGGAAARHIKGKQLTGLADSPAGIAGEKDLGGCRVSRGVSPRDVTVTFDFAPLTDMRTARLEVLERIGNGLFDGTDIRLAALGEEFFVISDEESAVYSDKYARLAPVRYSDAVSAFGDGVLFAARLCGKAADEFTPAGDAPVRRGGYDLIVCGLGAAGSIAAITAARLGLKVLGLEKGGQPGGVGTSGGIHSYYLGYSGGVWCEADELAAHLQERGFIRERGCGLLTKGMALDRLLAQSGADVIYGATVCGVERKGDTVDGVVWHCADGLFCADARMTVDATADAAVSLAAGCLMQGGRESDGGYQLFSNISRYLNRESGCTASKNQDDGVVDQYDPADLGIKTLSSATSALHLKDDFGNGRFRRLGAASYLGVREGLRIVGEETMTLAHAAECAPERAVFWELANLDSHAKDFPFESRTYRDFTELCSLWDCRISIPVTAGCLIPRGVRGLVAAGRNISMDHDVALACRMMRAMQKCGEAVGVMAYLAARDGVDVRDVESSELYRMLVGRGVIAPGTHYGIYFYSSDPALSFKRNIAELDAADIAGMLASDAPGAAVMACIMNEKTDSKTLVRLLDDPASRRGAALALAARGEVPAAADAVVEMIRDRSGDIPHSSHTFCLPYSVSAMSAAGRCGMMAAIPALLDIVCDPDYAEGIPNKDTVDDKTKLICDNGDVKYLWFAAALGALRDIFAVHPAAVRNALAGRAKPDVGRYVSGASMIGRTDGVRNDSGALMRAVVDGIWGA